MNNIVALNSDNSPHALILAKQLVGIHALNLGSDINFR